MVRVREAMGGVVLGACLAAWGCGNDAASSESSAGSSAAAGTAATAGSGHSGSESGSSSTGGSTAGGSTAGGGGSSSAGGSAAGSSAPSTAGSSGAGGAAPSGKELAVSHSACDPACPDHQYCAFEEIDCAGKPCRVRAICRDRPACDVQHMCGKMREKCLCDARGDCSPSNANWPGLCSCSENPYSCDALVLDERPSICECVAEPAPTTCLGANCPDNYKCEVVLGKQYCFTTAAK